MNTTTARRTVRVEVGRRSAWLHGPGVFAALEVTGTPRMRCPVRKVWTCPVDRLADVLAYLEHCQHRRVQLVDVDR